MHHHYIHILSQMVVRWTVNFFCFFFYFESTINGHTIRCGSMAIGICRIAENLSIIIFTKTFLIVYVFNARCQCLSIQQRCGSSSMRLFWKKHGKWRRRKGGEGERRAVLEGLSLSLLFCLVREISIENVALFVHYGHLFIVTLSLTAASSAASWLLL